MAKDYEEALKIVNQEISKHTEASGFGNIQKTDDDSESSAPRGASAKMTMHAHAQKHKLSSHGASEVAHSKTSTAGHERHLPHLKQLEAKAQSSFQKPQKPPAPFTRSYTSSRSTILLNSSISLAGIGRRRIAFNFSSNSLEATRKCGSS